MTEILLAAILVVLVFIWLDWRPQAIRDYVRWRWRRYKRKQR